MEISKYVTVTRGPSRTLSLSPYFRTHHHLPPVPDLHFVSHLTHNVHGEQLIAQLFRSIPERAWLFKYGRVPMSILMSEWVWSVRDLCPSPVPLVPCAHEQWHLRSD